MLERAAKVNRRNASLVFIKMCDKQENENCNYRLCGFPLIRLRQNGEKVQSYACKRDASSTFTPTGVTLNKSNSRSF